MSDGRVLCIDTLPVLILGYLFDKGVFVDTQQEVSTKDLTTHAMRPMCWTNRAASAGYAGRSLRSETPAAPQPAGTVMVSARGPRHNPAERLWRGEEEGMERAKSPTIRKGRSKAKFLLMRERAPPANSNQPTA